MMCSSDDRLVSIDLGKFSFSSGTTVPYYSYILNDCGVIYNVYVFHGQVQQYGKNGLCLRLPAALDREVGIDSKNYLSLVQLMAYGEEINGATYVFHRHFRTLGGNSVITIPPKILPNMDLRYWTVAFTLLDKSMLLQYDGYVYPSILKLEDPLQVCEHLAV